MQSKVISANRLRDGIVVYLTGDYSWSECISDAQVLKDEATSEAALSKANDAEAACIVVGPYLIDIHKNEGQYNPTRFRELIRLVGPTVRRDLARQVKSS